MGASPALNCSSGSDGGIPCVELQLPASHLQWSFNKGDAPERASRSFPLLQTKVVIRHTSACSTSE
jgi:hypothetical protein